MAGTVTTTEETYDTIKKITFTWLSSAGGAADATTTNTYNGAILACYQVPDTGGTAPTTLYDVVVNDGDGVDVLFGLGANLVITANTLKSSRDGLGIVAYDTLTLAVTNAGNAKGGKTILYIG